MGIFTDSSTSGIEVTLKNPDVLQEAFIYDELSHRLTEEEKADFINTEAADMLIREGLIGKNTLVRLSKNDDLTRRVTMASYQLAKENNDPLWDKLVKNRVMERKLIGQIRNKYSGKSSRAAKVAQKEYLKTNKITSSIFPLR